MKHTCPICKTTILMADYGKHMMEYHLDALKPAIKGEVENK